MIIPHGWPKLMMGVNATAQMALVKRGIAPAEPLWRTADGRARERDQPLANVGHRQALLRSRVERVDDRRRCGGGRDEAEEAAGLESRYARLGDGRDLGQALEALRGRDAERF